MQLIDRDTHTGRFETHSGTGSRLPDRIIYRRLLLLLAAGLMICLGPAVLNVLVQASLVATQIFLEASHVAVLAFQIFGHILGQ
jgi:hypothetical protein